MAIVSLLAHQSLQRQHHETIRKLEQSNISPYVWVLVEVCVVVGIYHFWFHRKKNEIYA